MGMNPWLRKLLGAGGADPRGGADPALVPVPPVGLGPPEALPPLTLAYLGDAVYELYIRDRVLRAPGARRPGQLHRAATGYVRAQAQARAMRDLQPELSETEADVVRRGRNAKTAHTRRHADPADYAMATAFEALLGYLYLSGQHERLAHVLERSTGRPG